MEKQGTVWEKIFASHVSNKGLVSEYKKYVTRQWESRQSNSKMGKKPPPDISLKKIHRWQGSTLKEGQHRCPLGKRRLKS